MQPDDPNHRPTTPSADADQTRTFAVDPSATLAHLGPPITGPVATWPAGLTRYKPLHLLGDGGMGEVYLAHDTQLDRQIAIKFARRTTSDTAARILSEARAAARLHHAGICPVFDADVCDGVPYLTMAFVQGPNLAAELKRLGPCPPAYAARLVRSVAEAMQYAHDSGVIHRDLKPANILLNADHEPVVTDFGLAVRTDREGLAEGVISGTPHYMAPEQAAGDATNIGERTDVFALGVILFEMLTGRVPFDGTHREVLEQVKTKAVPPVRKVRRQVPERLARIVAKATARDPADRYDSMTAFADALTNSLSTTQAPKKKGPLAWLFWAVVIPTGVLLGGCLLVCGIGILLPAMQKVRDAASRIRNQKEREEQVATLTREGQEAHSAGRLDLAEGSWTEALRVDPEAAGPRQLRGWLHERQGRYREALDDFDVLVGQEPNNEQYRRNRAAVNIKSGRFREAVADLDFAARLRSDWTGTYTLRGEARLELKEYDQALADLNRAIELDPKNARAFRLRATVREWVNDLAGSEADALRATELGDKPPTPPVPPK